jgi:hypothetical protein
MTKKNHCTQMLLYVKLKENNYHLTKENRGSTCFSHAYLIALSPSSRAAGWIHIHNWRCKEL